MKTPTIEEVNEYFKDAKTVLCASYNFTTARSAVEDETMELSNIETHRLDDGVLYYTGVMDLSNIDSYSILWSESQGYADIIEYKENKCTKTPKITYNYLECIKSDSEEIKKGDTFKSVFEDQFAFIIESNGERYFIRKANLVCNHNSGQSIFKVITKGEFKEKETEIIDDLPNKAKRFNDNKLNWSLVDFESLEGMVKVLEFGANKYEANNWKKGLYYLKTCESLLRHLFAFMRGVDTDEESGLLHIDHVLCNAMFLSYMFKNKKEFDDRK